MLYRDSWRGVLPFVVEKKLQNIFDGTTLSERRTSTNAKIFNGRTSLSMIQARLAIIITALSFRRKNEKNQVSQKMQNIGSVLDPKLRFGKWSNYSALFLSKNPNKLESSVRKVNCWTEHTIQTLSIQICIFKSTINYSIQHQGI